MRFYSFFFLLFATVILSAQNTDPEFNIDRYELAGNLHFLSSDFLKGRYTGEPGNVIAAQFLAEHLEAYGYTPPAGHDSYFQEIPFDKTTPPAQASLTIGGQVFTQGDNLLVMGGNAIATKAEVIFADYGWVSEDGSRDDYRSLAVKGNIVVVLPGSEEGQDPSAIFEASQRKRQLAAERGAVALIELYRLPFPWQFFKRYFAKGGISLAADTKGADTDKLFYGWIQESAPSAIPDVEKRKKVKGAISSTGFAKTGITSPNVIGVLPGSDPALRDEYILLTAHFDHIGVGEQGNGAVTEEDNIFNGARDNGLGVVSILAAAKALAQSVPRRSIIVLFVTGEEIGLLGSSYYANHPLIPLNQVVFNLNADGAGYNTTDAISIIGWGRTGTNELIEAGVRPFNLDIIKDPAAEQNLFDRSDNVSFAKKGIPALNFAPGMTDLDDEINKYYHQVTDEAESVDFFYLKRYAQALAHTARMLANSDDSPIWIAKDKYEQAGKKLYK